MVRRRDRSGVGSTLLGLLLAVVLAASACTDGDDGRTDLVSQAETDADGGDADGAAEGNVGNVPAPVGGGDTVDEDPTVGGSGDDDSGDGDPDASGSASPGEACRASGYELQAPPGWFHFECTHFSPLPISVNPATCGCQFPIDAAVARNESFDEAVERIRSRPDIWRIEAEESRFVDGRVALRLDTLVAVAGRTVDRRLVIIDLGNGTLFVAATDRADQAPDSLAYNEVLTGLNTLLDSADLRPL